MTKEIKTHLEEKEPFLILRNMRNYLAYYPETLVVDTYVEGKKTQSKTFITSQELEASVKENTQVYRQFRSQAKAKE